MGHNQILSQPSLNASATSDNSIFHPPASIEISSKVSTEEPSLRSEDSSTLTFLEEDASIAQYSHEETPSSYSDCSLAALDGPIRKRQRTPSSYLDCGATVLDEPIPKRQRHIEDLWMPRFRLVDVCRANPKALLGRNLADFIFSGDVVFNQHSLQRLKVRGGIRTQENALQLMSQGTIVENKKPKHRGLMVLFCDRRGVQHQFPLLFCARDNSVLVKTYMAVSPFKGQRRCMMLDSLEWLSSLLDVPLPLIGEYVARAVTNLDHRDMLYCPGLPEVMDVIHNILPTHNEINLLSGIPFASEMGQPENWVMAIGRIWDAPERVALMRMQVFQNHEIEKLNWV